MGRGKAKATMELVEAARDFLEINAPATVRSCCYQLFINGYIKNMGRNETNKVSRHLVWAREEGIIPWSWIVDESREGERQASWNNPQELIEAAVSQYRRDYWQDQAVELEVWSEKGTVRGTLWPVLRKYGVTFRVMHGYTSATTIQSFASSSANSEKPIHICYVGDWDPSGMAMSEIDIPTRLERYGGRAHFERIAIVESDTRTGLPYFDANTKKGDSRHKWFVEKYGSKCWELDAMSPNILRQRVEEFIVGHLDLDLWNRAVKVEAAEVESMQAITSRIQEIISGQASKYGDGA
ncbi:MAG: hypothetical protein U5L98_09935 [Halomonas sp.]|uniref:hypothetical protein n=1 Tax=Halomonas sp. TaxID=1486246 RepID=UPI002ACD21DC|nr:hypothetical protein [Halomonas sp.]MDZ7852944.1 hypothetical protein [Halomonas sp.]